MFGFLEGRGGGTTDFRNGVFFVSLDFSFDVFELISFATELLYC